VSVFYTYTPDASAKIDLLSSGQPVPKDLSSDVRQKLVEAGVLRLQTETNAQRETRERERVELTNRSRRGATLSCRRLFTRFNSARFGVTTES
jgi:hypothetical protein